MDTKSEVLATNSELIAAPAPKDSALQSASNPKSGNDSESNEKLSQSLKSDEKEVLLCMNSENAPIEGSCDVKNANAEGKKSDKYFSDIESSDNSQEYEVESMSKKEDLLIEKEVVKTANKKESKDKCKNAAKGKEPSKTIELELELVESDEEDFEENVLTKANQKETTENVTGSEEALRDLEDISDKEDTGETVSTIVDADIEDSSQSEILETTKEQGIISENAPIDNECKKGADGKVQAVEDEALSKETDPKEVVSELDETDKATASEQQEGVNASSAIDREEDISDKINVVELKDEAENNSSSTAKETSEEIDKEVESDLAIENPGPEANILDAAEKSPGNLKELPHGDSTVKGKDEEVELLVENAKKSSEELSPDPADPTSEKLESASSNEIKEIDDKCSTENSAQIGDPPVDEQMPIEENTSGSTNSDAVLEGATKSHKTKLNVSEKEKVAVVVIEGESVTKEEEAVKISSKEDVDEIEPVAAGKENKKDDKDARSTKETQVNEGGNGSPPPADAKEKENVEHEQKNVPELPKPSEDDAKKTVQPNASAEATIPSQPAEETKSISKTDNPPSAADYTSDKPANDDVCNLKEKLTTKVSELLKTIDSSSQQGLTSDDDESLLVIDTTHKDDPENEDNDMDTEAAASDTSSDGSLEIFYHKECSNYDCGHGSKNFYRAPQFALNYYKVSRKLHKSQFVCEDCYDQALHAYEEMCVILKQKQPLYGAKIKRQDFVEIIDSSDEEDTDSNADNCKDENTFPKESIEFLENELEGIIRNVMESVDIQNQLSWTKQFLQQGMDRVREESSYVSEQLQQLQKKADKMHNSLYQCPSIKIRQLTPLDLNSGRSYSPESELTIPAVGDIERPSIQVNETYYAVKNKAIASWVPCKVIEEVEDGTSLTKNLKHYKIKFLKSKYPMLKTLSAKHMAYFDAPKVRLPIGTRVIAYFDASSLSRGKEKMLIPSAFYPGIIAEPLKMSNKFRYLVFYDDGYFQYVSYKDVRLVCHASENVWDDVHHQSRDFIQNYLTQYAVNRPMVQTQKGQCMLVDYNGKWVYARVVDVDCSLVQMMFEGQSRSEWIYRGSTRLGPVYKESNNIAPKTSWNQSRISRRTEPFIRYLNDEDSSSQSHSQSQQNAPKSGEVRSVAKKSVSRADAAVNPQPVPVVKHLNNSTIFVDDDNKPKGKVVYYTARKNLPPRDFLPHICSPSCPFVITHNLQFYSPLAKPLLSGWERQVFRQKSKKFIVYRAPCGKRLRTMEELHRYLRVTNNELNVDNFDFSSETNCLAEYVIESCIVQKKDISNGEEKMPIPCVNYYDNTMPPDCKYSSKRIPTEGVHLNLSSDFLVGCDCDDDCSDKSKCSCWQLTYAGAKYSMPNVPHEMVGYQYKRLYAHVPTGIYECNSRCKCKSNCVNRVVQQPLQSKLQVFKTSNRGWGLRCINDVPRGSFICIYAGHLLTEQKANEGGLDAGDEYFAELDYIEVAEQIKEGYESDVAEADEEEEMYNPDKDDDDDEFIAPDDSYRSKSISTRLSTRRSTKNSSDAEHDSQERQVISFEPNKSQERPDSAGERPTMRRLFGKDEGTYIMDAKITGNLGRYFNHSCSPNLFVQNVFVDTHDLRFPWVAFFAFSHIRAGTELTWNYNYEVGVVPGKVLYCQCGAPNCRQRLL